ncbi:hypothetical protein YC2023_082049 [Brassica napus]
MRTVVVRFADADAAADAAAYYIATAGFIGVSRRTRRSDAESDAASCVNETNKRRIAKCDSKLGVKPKIIPQLGSKAKKMKKFNKHCRRRLSIKSSRRLKEDSSVSLLHTDDLLVSLLREQILKKNSNSYLKLGEMTSFAHRVFSNHPEPQTKATGIRVSQFRLHPISEKSDVPLNLIKLFDGLNWFALSGKPTRFTLVNSVPQKAFI